jgi:hypothetical protein
MKTTITNYYNHICSQWGYTPTESIATGYESVLHTLRTKYSKQAWEALDSAGKDSMQQDVFDLYRSINIVPVNYYSLDACKQQLIDLSTK